MSCHPTRIYYTLEDMLEKNGCMNAQTKEEIDRKKYFQKVWRRHINKNGNVPFIERCYICSGKALKDYIKNGIWKEKRPSKVVRDEQYGRDNGI